MEYWQHQTSDKPLYPDIIWSKPETASGAGKLLIIGGSVGNFADVARTFTDAESAGAGTIHLLVPEILRPITKQIPFINYAPHNPSGSFSRKSLAEFLDLGQIVDGTLIAGDLGRNSETSLLLEDFMDKYTGWLIIAPQAIESFACGYQKILNRDHTVLFLNYDQLRALAIELKSEIALTSDIPKSNLAKLLHDLTSKNPNCLLIFEQNPDSVWTSYKGNIAETTGPKHNPAKSAVWLIQQTEKPFQSLVSSLVI